MAGRVFKARDQVLKKNVVIKTLHSDLSTGEELQRFQREAKAFSSLEHPNILKVLDFGLSEDQVPYLVMAYVEGESFDKYLARNAPLAGHVALALTAQICQAMQHAHSRGVLHRDLKPSNLLILEDSRGELHIYILDFGLAKVSDPNSGAINTLTKPGQLLGTAEYMSPEQASGQKCDSASDIYSVGCILFEMVSGSPPFTGKALLEVIRQQKEESPPLERLKDQSQDIDVASIVEKALQKNPADRFASMQEMHDAITFAFEDLPASESTIAYPTPGKNAAPNKSSSTSPDSSSPKRRLRPELYIVLAVLTTTLILVTIAIMLSHGDFQNDVPENQVSKNDMYELADGADLLRGSIDSKRLNLSRAINADARLARTFDERKDIRAIEADYSDISDKSMPYIFKWHAFSVVLTGTAVTDHGLARLRGSDAVRYLAIDATPGMTGRSIKILPSLSFLRVARIGNASLEDADLEPLKDCSSLNELVINSAPLLTGKALEHIGKPVALKTIKIGDCPGISQVDIDKFKTDNPSIDITASAIPVPAISEGSIRQTSPSPEPEILD